MSYDTLFITDLHGNLDALRRALRRGEESTNLRYLIIGGDIAPNLVTIRLRDGEFVLRHDESYGAKVSEDFRSRLRDRRQYQREDQHGKRPVTTIVDMDAATFLSLANDETRALLEPLSSFDFLRQRQIDFVEAEFLPLLHSLGKSGIEVFVMLGNDDFVELESSLLRRETSGRFTYIHNRIVPLGNSQILGYSCVLSKPFRYRHWERTEGEFATDLAMLIEGRDTSRLILSIHMPPFGTNLDMLGVDHSHAGSRTVRTLIQENRFGIGLFGHIHESHLVSGSRHDCLGQTAVINPGGYHDDECCAVIFDSGEPSNWQGLW